MKKKLFMEAIIKYISGLIIVGVLIFLPAGSFYYWNGWLLIGLLFIPMFIVGIILFIKNPGLLKNRLNAKEKESEQKIVLLFSSLMFITGFILSGLNFRYKWIEIPTIVVITSSVLFIVFYLLYGVILKENAYLLRTIDVKDNQKVIDTGLYGIVRHPMYMVTIGLFLMMPLVLGSLYSLIIFLIYPIIIVKRIKNEEKVLEKDLKGYIEYEKKVRYRLIPYIW